MLARHRRLRPTLLALALAPCLACGSESAGEPEVDLPTLDPEPAGSPTSVADGRLSCLGAPADTAEGAATIQLLAWVRTWADPDNDGGLQPAARLEAFDTSGQSLGVSFSDPSNGRTALSVPTRTGTFTGSVVATAEGYLDWYVRSSAVYAPPSNAEPPAGWVWLISEEELEAGATDAGIELQAGSGLLAGAVHDCDGFGIANALIRWSGATAGVTYLVDPAYQNSASGIGEQHFTPDLTATFTSTSGRFVIPNVAPGTVTVEAYARTQANGPLVRISTIDVDVVANAVTAVDLQPTRAAP